MNILRVWGGAIVNKEPFYELCDELGIMVWQEFPLACNNYIGTEEYLKVLEQEAIAIIKRIKQHVCLALWCGGNELFNGWSKMTDQSRALRMLNKLCYEYDINTPFIMTSPIMGMAHGHYVFYDFDIDKTVFEIFQESSNTAYTEFGIPSITKLEYLEKIIPKEELDIKNKSISWELHHAYKAWGEERWMCKEIIDKIFGKKETLNDYIEKSNWLQCEGYKAIFEEARRQKPTCSMALNWCYNEPWITAAGNSLITYPNNPKPAYYAVKDALRPVMPSAKIEHFGYIGGEMLMAELWYLNDSPKEIQDTVSVYIEIDGNKEHIMDWHTGIVDKNTNKRGHKICYQLPKARMQKIKLILEGDEETSVYELLLKEEKTVNIIPHTLNV